MLYVIPLLELAFPADVVFSSNVVMLLVSVAFAVIFWATAVLTKAIASIFAVTVKDIAAIARIAIVVFVFVFMLIIGSALFIKHYPGIISARLV